MSPGTFEALIPGRIQERDGKGHGEIAQVGVPGKNGVSGTASVSTLLNSTAPGRAFHNKPCRSPRPVQRPFLARRLAPRPFR